MASEAQSPLQNTQPSLPRSIDADEALISTIFEKSREGKILWHREDDSYRASTNGNLVMALETTDLPVFGRTWSCLTVSRSSKELLKLESKANGTNWLSLAGWSLGAKEQLITQLLQYLEHVRKEEVRSAVREVEQL